jgi:hypothetical protein
VTSKVLNVVKSLHQARKEHIESSSDIIWASEWRCIKRDDGLPQRTAYNKDPAVYRRRREDPFVFIVIGSREAGRPVSLHSRPQLKSVED